MTSSVNEAPDDYTAKYRWLADGTKVGTSLLGGVASLEYLGSLVYKYVNGELQLESTAFGGGRILASDTGTGYDYTPNYFITDHLGSTRAVVELTAGGTANVTERSDFYPFGARHINPAAAISDNRYRFSGKEEQHAFGLPYNDHGARMYDPVTGRWIVVDPLANKYYPISPYMYCAGNPIRLGDPNGMYYIDKTKSTIYVSNGVVRLKTENLN